ncbi:DUF4112 domain-containing protein [Roseiconus nitratireducens]|uniref:DUF4112 domain-containing protein n=2 Tax=Roseiconus nitratireducens TaxID=2605748 RepID=A0A5M6CV52_9BACT|nr:DUF4112 domain-containing protein [Roseiconus nitratireducens]
MRRLARFAKWMDAKYQLPGVPIRFGVDSLIGLVPGVGDLVGTLIGVYILREAHSAGAPKVMLARMSGNLLIDFIGGSVPLLGDLFDIYWKANIRNVQLLEKHVSANLKKTQ